MQQYERERQIQQPKGIDALRTNELFQRLAVPITADVFPEIRDAEFFVRKDGLIINAEGWYHPDGKIIGEVLYAPDPQGDRTIFGQRYKKITLYPGTYTPVPYEKRSEAVGIYDSSLNQTGENPYFARYKQIFPREDFGAYLPARPVLEKVLKELTMPSDQIRQDLANAQQLLGLDFRKMNIGLTGGLLLGNFRGFHDLDLVFQESLEENLRIAKRTRDLVRRDLQRRVIEGGKGWNIRYYNDNGTLMCNFFTYKNPADAPLRDFEMKVVAEDVQIEATVLDDTHTIYTPSVLGISGVRLNNIGEKDTERKVPDENMRLIVYHTATRGECFAGDKVKAKGALAQIKTPKEEYMAICVIDREGIRNSTPTWEGYYEHPDIA